MNERITAETRRTRRARRTEAVRNGLLALLVVGMGAGAFAQEAAPPPEPSAEVQTGPPEATDFAAPLDGALASAEAGAPADANVPLVSAVRADVALAAVWAACVAATVWADAALAQTSSALLRTSRGKSERMV